jgi:hypothetical protein
MLFAVRGGRRPTDGCVAAVQQIDYFRCDLCWHIWSVNRETGETIEHLTPRTFEKTSLK